MPFRFSDLANRGKSRCSNNSRVFEAAEVAPPYYPSSAPSPSPSLYSRPMTADSVDFRPREPPPSPPPPPPMSRMVPGRADTATPASLSYDNGTGRLHGSLVQEHGLPSHVRTTEQLAAFIKSQRQHGSSSASNAPLPPPSSSFPCVPRSSSSHYSSSATTLYHHPSSTGSYERTRPVAGIRHRYDVPPVARILPGATRTHEYQGFWLRRGTTRKAESEQRGSKKWSSNKAESKHNHVETSGWYDD